MWDILCYSDESGRNEVYVQSPGVESLTLVQNWASDLER